MIQLLVQREAGESQVILHFFLRNSGTFRLIGDCSVEGISKEYSAKGVVIHPGELCQLYSIPNQFVESSPVFHYQMGMYSTVGLEGQFRGQLKIRAKDFVTKQQYSSDLGGPATIYKLEVQEGEKQSKISYKRKSEDLAHGRYRKIDLYNTEEYVNFNPVLDLHLEKLVEDPSKINAQMVLMIQLSALNKYLDQALRIGVDRVFIIHGVGQGKLRKAVGEIAGKLTGVKEAKNEYHPKFGFGATEIIFE